jgi:O-antigen ligase
VLPRAVAFDRDLAMVGLLHVLTYIGVFVLAVVLPQVASEVRTVLGVIVISATIATVAAMVAASLNRLSPYTGMSVWLPGQAGEFTATFINPNNYATYAGVSALAALCLGIPAPVAASRLTPAQRWRTRLLLVSGRRGLWLAAGLVLTAGVLLSGSRGGWSSLLAGVLVVLLSYLRGAGRVAAVVLVVAAFALIGIVSPGGERLMGKAVHLVERGEVGRPLLYQLTATAIDLRPLLGWGLNCFADLYPVFQPASLTLLFDKAHNTYLELALDLGIPAALAVVLAVATIAARCAKGFASRSRDRELAMLGVSATVLVGVHALADFSLQIPGMACTYFALLGLAWNQSWSSRSVPRKSKTSLRK